MQVSKKPQVIDGLPRFDLIINYTAKTKKFSIPLPPFLSAPLGTGEVTGATQDEVEKLFHAAIEQVRTLKKTTRKVIVYEISYQDHMGKILIVFSVAVATETKTIVGDKENVSYEALPSSLQGFNIYRHGRYLTVEWTPEREQWFSSIREYLTAFQDDRLCEKGKVAAQSRYNDIHTFTFDQEIEAR